VNIAVTGGMGAGKSFVASKFAALIGAENISADLICRDLLEIGGTAYRQMQHHFDSDYFLDDGQLNRSFLREAIFRQKNIRSQVDALLHPLVRSELLERCQQAREQSVNLVVEVPLLFEKGWQGDFDTTLVVFADENTCLDRIIARDRVSKDSARAGVASQMALSEKCKLGDLVVDNSGSRDHTCKQLTKVSQTLSRNPLFKGNNDEALKKA